MPPLNVRYLAVQLFAPIYKDKDDFFFILGERERGMKMGNICDLNEVSF